MLRPQKEKKPPQPGKLKMFGHFGHLGHLTPKPQQNRLFFNLSKMANNKYLGHLAPPRNVRSARAPLIAPCSLRSPVEAWMPKSSMLEDQRIGISCLLTPSSLPKKTC
jgi:hypothetical protein